MSLLLLTTTTTGLSPQSMEEAGGPGVSGDLAVSPAEGGEVGAHTDAGGSTEVAARLCGQTGRSPLILSLEGKCFLRGPTERESALLQTSLLPRLDQPPVDGVHGLLLFVFLRGLLSVSGPHSIAEQRSGGGRQQDGSLG